MQTKKPQVRVVPRGTDYLRCICKISSVQAEEMLVGEWGG